MDVKLPGRNESSVILNTVDMLEQWKGSEPQEEARPVFSQNSHSSCCYWRQDALLDGPLVQSSQALRTFLRQSEVQNRRWTLPRRSIYSTWSDLWVKLYTVSKAHEASWESLMSKVNWSPFLTPLFVYCISDCIAAWFKNKERDHPKSPCRVGAMAPVETVDSSFHNL